jgi:hypothetical protein
MVGHQYSMVVHQYSMGSRQYPTPAKVQSIFDQHTINTHQHSIKLAIPSIFHEEPFK